MSFSNGQASTTTPTWTEPPWCGWIETTGDALLILEAARRGLIPRVTRRLVDAERKMISSGSVFVFDEDESGIKRWTDGFFWSPSRILGNFLLYRETDNKKATGRGRGGGPAGGDSADDEAGVLSRPKSGPHAGPDRQRERNLVGSLTNNPKFKSDGLMKKTFSLSIGGVAQHLISYYRVEDVENGRLRSPSSLPELASLAISPEYLDKTHFRNPPKVEIGPDGIPRYRGEADDAENGLGITRSPNPSMAAAGPPLLSDGSVNNPGKRARYEPYPAAGPSDGKRPRNQRSTDEADKTPSPMIPHLPAEVAYPTAPAQVSVPATPVPAVPGQPYPQSDAALAQQQPGYPEPQVQSTSSPAPSAPPPVSQVPPYYAYFTQPGHSPYAHAYPYHHPALVPPSTVPAASGSTSAAPPTAAIPSTTSPPPVTGGTPTPAPAHYPHDPNAPPQHQHQQQPYYYPYPYSYPPWPAAYSYPTQVSTPTIGTEKAATPPSTVPTAATTT